MLIRSRLTTNGVREWRIDGGDEGDRRLADRGHGRADRAGAASRGSLGGRALPARSLHARRAPWPGPALGRRPPARCGRALRRHLPRDGSEHRHDHPDRLVAEPRRGWISRGAGPPGEGPQGRGPLPHPARAMTALEGRERLRLAVPNKGRLVEPTVELLRDAGLVFEEHERSLVARVRNFDLDILFVRTNDVIEFVGDGVADLGVTGEDLLAETGAELPRLRSLGYGHCRLAAAVPTDSPHRTIADLAGLRVATAHPQATRRFFAAEGVEVDVIPISGAVEVAPRLGLAEAIVDLVSTGST